MLYNIVHFCSCLYWADDSIIKYSSILILVMKEMCILSRSTFGILGPKLLDQLLWP